MVKPSQKLHVVATPLHNVFSNRELTYDTSRAREILNRLEVLRKNEDSARKEFTQKHRIHLGQPPEQLVDPLFDFAPEGREEYRELKEELQAIHASEPFGGLDKDDPVFLVSAHVETSESSGIIGTLIHFLESLGKVADYQSGKEKGRDLLLRNVPSEFKKVVCVNSKCTETPLFDVGINPLKLFRGVLQGIQEDESSAVSAKPYLPADMQDASKREKFWLAVEKIVKKIAELPKSGLPHGLVVVCSFFLLVIFPIIAFAMGFLALDAGGLLTAMDKAGKIQQVIFLELTVEHLWSAVYITFIWLSIGFSVGLIYSGLKRLPYSEKSGLLGILSGLAIFPVGFIIMPTSHTSLSLEFRALSFVALGSFIFLNYVFLAGFSYPHLRLVTVAVFALVLGEIFIPMFIAGGIVRILSLLVFSIVFLFLVSIFFNFMKSVELIHELEHGFALFVGNSGEQRQALNHELQTFIGISDKHSAYQRFAEIIRVYLGFRPQGDIEFHLPLEETENRDTTGTVFPIYPVKDICFDGDKLQISLEISNLETASLAFSGFQPQ